jgi:hypothetical protein
MSYDLMVFDTNSAPKSKAVFQTWYDRQVQWTEGHSYDDPKVCSPALTGWFDEMRLIFPPLNGPYALSDNEFDRRCKEDKNFESKLTDYSIGKSVIYVSTVGKEAMLAEETARRLADKHKIGLYNPQSGETIFFDDKRRFDLTTNSHDKSGACWDDIRKALDGLKDNKGEFVTIEEKPPTGSGLFMQAFCENGVYYQEIQLVNSGTDFPRYNREFSDYSEVVTVFNDWFVWGQLPDLATYNDITASAISNPKRASDVKDYNDFRVVSPEFTDEKKRTNKIVKTFIVVISAGVILGLIAYMLKNFF